MNLHSIQHLWRFQVRERRRNLEHAMHLESGEATLIILWVVGLIGMVR